jgi:hypothetical protein
MYSRASVHGSIRESVGISEVTTAAERAGPPSSRGKSFRFVTQLAAEPSKIDADLYLFALCAHLQSICLDRHGIGCILDADGAGRLPEAVCRILGAMVCELINDAGVCTCNQTAERTVRVTLRRRGTACLCTVSRCSDSCPCEKPGLWRARELASELNDGCSVRPVPDHGLTAIMFDLDLVEGSLAAQIWPYRREQASQFDGRLSAMVLE